MAKRSYSQEEKEAALIVAASKGYKPAARDLGIDESTIRYWARHDPERWAEIRETEAPKWRARAAADAEDLADRNRELAEKALEQAERDLAAGDLEPKDYLNLLKTATLGMGISIDKANTLRDRPTEVVEHRYDAMTLQRALRAATERLEIVESTAVEVEPTALEQGTQG